MKKKHLSKSSGSVTAIAVSFLFLSCCTAGSALGANTGWHADNSRGQSRFNAIETRPRESNRALHQARHQNRVEHRADRDARLLDTLIHHIPARTLSIDPINGRGGDGPAHFRGPHGFHNRLELNLMSSSADIVLGSRLFGDQASVTITVGGVTKTVSAGEHVTPAEYVAIKQVLSGADQSLTLDSFGTAIGGTFELNQVLSPNVRELVVPNNVTGIDYISRNRSLGIRGDLSNYGSIYGVSTDENVRSGLIFARDINNGYGGTISTILPEALAATIDNEVSDVSLTLAAFRNINNHGTISSGGTLTLATATGAITNAGSPHIFLLEDQPGMAHPDYVIYDPILPYPPKYPPIRIKTSVISAVGDINLVSGSGNVYNNGDVRSTNGNININSTRPDMDISVTGIEGKFEALNGNINVRDPQYEGTNNIYMLGGDYLSKNLNLYSGTGTIAGSVGTVSGNLNTVGDASAFETGVHWYIKFAPNPYPGYPIPEPPPGYPFDYYLNVTPVVN